MTQFVFDAAKAALGSGTLAWPASTLRVLLIGDGYVPAQSDPNLNDISGHECAGPGYVRQTLTGASVTVDNPNNRALYDANDAAWAGANFGSCTGALIFQRVGASDNAAVDVPIVYFDFASTTNGGNLLLQFSDSPAAVFVLS